MKYLSEIFALNLNCALETCGDWHQSALNWQKIRLRESDGSLWGDYGIESNVHIPEHTETYFAANHIRALLDLLYDGNFAVAQGMRDDFICNAKYTQEIFKKVMAMQTLNHWPAIDAFMGKEYCRQWLDFNRGLKLAF